MKTKNGKKKPGQTSKKSNVNKVPSFCGLESNKNEEEIISRRIEEEKDIYKNDNDANFCGLISKEGKLKMRTKYNIQKQAVMHSLTLKERKRKNRILRRQREIEREKIAARREVKPKQGTRKPDLEEEKLNKLINDYESEITTFNCRKKWYDNDN